MGTILDRARAASERPAAERCVFGAWLVTKGPEFADDVGEALEDPDVATAALYRILVAEGVPCKAGTVGRHRRWECVCPR